MKDTPNIDEVAALFADRSRAEMLLELLDGTARPVSHLAASAGIAVSTASEHLSKLAKAGIVRMERDGRVRRYRLANGDVALVLESLVALAETPAPIGLKEVNKWDRLRVARSCYDHLAGVLGTDLFSGLVEAGTLLCPALDGDLTAAELAKPGGRGSAQVQLSDAAPDHFRSLGIDLTSLASARRPMLKTCKDWTEQRYHLAGGLGAAIMRAFIAQGWIEKRPGRRDLCVVAPEAIHEWVVC